MSIRNHVARIALFLITTATVPPSVSANGDPLAPSAVSVVQLDEWCDGAPVQRLGGAETSSVQTSFRAAETSLRAAETSLRAAETCDSDSVQRVLIYLGPGQWSGGRVPLSPVLPSVDESSHTLVHRLVVTEWGDATAVVVGDVELTKNGRVGVSTFSPSGSFGDADWSVSLAGAHGRMPRLALESVCAPRPLSAMSAGARVFAAR